MVKKVEFVYLLRSSSHANRAVVWSLGSVAMTKVWHNRYPAIPPILLWEKEGWDISHQDSNSQRYTLPLNKYPTHGFWANTMFAEHSIRLERDLLHKDIKYAPHNNEKLIINYCASLGHHLLQLFVFLWEKSKPYMIHRLCVLAAEITT